MQAEVYKLTGIEHCVSSAYHPQTNGLTERFNQTLQTALLKLVNNTEKIGMNIYHQCSLHIELLNKRQLNYPHLKLCIAGKLYLFFMHVNLLCTYAIYP